MKKVDPEREMLVEREKAWQEYQETVQVAKSLGSTTGAFGMVRAAFQIGFALGFEQGQRDGKEN